MAELAISPCSRCAGLQFCTSCGSMCGYFRTQATAPCDGCRQAQCVCLPNLPYPCITEWYWVGGKRAPHHMQVHGIVHFPPWAAVPRFLDNHGTISTSRIRHVLSVRYGLVRTFSGSIYQLHPHSHYHDTLPLAQRPILVPYELLYLHRLLATGRAVLHRADDPLRAWWQMPHALFAMVLHHLLPLLETA